MSPRKLASITKGKPSSATKSSFKICQEGSVPIAQLILVQEHQLCGCTSADLPILQSTAPTCSILIGPAELKAPMGKSTANPAKTLAHLFRNFRVLFPFCSGHRPTQINEKSIPYARIANPRTPVRFRYSPPNNLLEENSPMFPVYPMCYRGLPDTSCVGLCEP